MNWGALSLLLHVDLPRRQGAGTCYIVGQQYSEKFPEVVMVELSNGTDTPHFQYRFEVLRDIEAGWNYYIAELNGGKLLPLQKVRVVTVGREQFLRIDDRAEARDYLGEIPEI
ncbi:MAG: hypothetical protein OHK0011_13140 [Turneriella sp.]